MGGMNMYWDPTLGYDFNFGLLIGSSDESALVRTTNFGTINDIYQAEPLKAVFGMSESDVIELLMECNHSITQPAMIEIISKIASGQNRSSLITIWTETRMAMGTVIANLIVQVISAVVGLQLSFLAFAALDVIGFCILLTASE